MEASEMTGSELEKRIDRLESIEAIKQLRALYCEICDDDHNPDRITQVFAEDAIWEAGEQGRGQGHDAIRKIFEGFREQISFSQHNIFNPRIEIEGDRAWGSWYLLGPFTFREGNSARWLAVRQDDEYVRQNGVWLFQHLRATIRMNAPHLQGWA